MVPRPNLGDNSMNPLALVHSTKAHSLEHYNHVWQGESNIAH